MISEELRKALFEKERSTASAVAASAACEDKPEEVGRSRGGVGVEGLCDVSLSYKTRRLEDRV